MSTVLLKPTTQNVTQTIAATGAGTAFVLKQAESYYAEVVLTTSAGTVDIALQHSTDSGATWQTLPLKFGQVAAAPGNSSPISFKTMAGLSDAATAFTPALTGAAQAANVPFNIAMVRPYVTLGTAGATTFSIRFTMMAKGTTVE